MKKKFYVVSLIFFLLDLISKIVVINFENYFPIEVIRNFFTLDKVLNDGAAFSSFSGYGIILIIIAILVLLYINISLIKDVKSKLEFTSLAMLTGGILGNLFDRIFYGKVIDFLSFNIFNYNFPVFNLADIFICIGVLLLIVDYLRGDKFENNSRKNRR